MKSDIMNRITRLKNQLVSDGGIIATFRNGTQRKMDGGNCILLIQRNPEAVHRFDAQESEQGLLPDLLNALIGD